MSFLRMMLMAIAVAGASARDSVAASIPAGGKSLLAGDATTALEIVGTQKHLGSLQLVDVQGQSFERAVRVTTSPGATAEWNLQLRAPLAGAIKSGDVLLGHFWMRCGESMTGDGSVGFVVEQNSPPNEKAVDMRLTVGGKWTEFFVPFKAGRDFPAGESQLCLRLGYDRQTLEIGGLELLNFGSSVKLEDLPRTKITYLGREADAAWRKDALDRIEKIRKSDLTVTVVDSSGRPVPGARVSVALKHHSFGFGSCVTTELLTAQTPDAQKYRDFVEKHLNRAVFENDMKWPAVYDGISPKTDEALDWLLARNIQVRGHNLVWPSWRWSPPQLKQYADNPSELRHITNKHITDVVTHFRGRLYAWDVVNEPFSNHDIIDVLGGQSSMVEWFKLAHQADPACKLFLNDYGIVEGGQTNTHREHFFKTLQYVKDSGAPLHGIGIQSHFASDLPAPTQLLSVLDRFATLGLPIESTELSLNIDDPQLQAEYMRDYMIAFFSHPKVEAIMLWGFWEKRHWRPQAALFSADWTIKPVGQTWVDLITRQWTTKADAATDAKGQAIVRGFLGSYDVTVTNGKNTATASVPLNVGGSEVRVILDTSSP